MASRDKDEVEKLLKPAGIRINGSQSWDIQVHDERLYRRLLSDGSLGAGETYMDGWWDVANLEELCKRAFRIQLDVGIGGKIKLARAVVLSKLRNSQSIARSFINARHHYDIGNDLYQIMLGSTMTYSCGYWPNAKALDEAQIAKLDLVCRKLKLKPGMRILDIGCGWGSFVRHAVQNYKVECVGTTLSQEQANYAREQVKGMPIQILQKDYRQLKARPFDRIVSIGMFEHVGPQNHRTFMEVCDHLLKPEGLMLLHTIGSNHTARTGDPWMEHYIFPGGVLPSIEDINKATSGIYIMEDWHNFGPDYARTLRAWWKNFDKHYEQLDHQRYDERFYRMWKFYLQACAANFATRGIQLWQVVLSKRSAEWDYRSVR